MLAFILHNLKPDRNACFMVSLVMSTENVKYANNYIFRI